jgi:hypothetical protein
MVFSPKDTLNIIGFGNKDGKKDSNLVKAFGGSLDKSSIISKIYLKQEDITELKNALDSLEKFFQYKIILKQTEEKKSYNEEERFVVNIKIHKSDYNCLYNLVIASESLTILNIPKIKAPIATYQKSLEDQKKTIFWPKLRKELQQFSPELCDKISKFLIEEGGLLRYYNLNHVFAQRELPKEIINSINEERGKKRKIHLSNPMDDITNKRQNTTQVLPKSIPDTNKNPNWLNRILIAEKDKDTTTIEQRESLKDYIKLTGNLSEQQAEKDFSRQATYRIANPKTTSEMSK